LHNLFDSDIIIDIVYYVTRSINGLCMLFRVNYKSRHLYVEILYFEETQMQKSSVIVTYSVQRFLDHIVSNYDHILVCRAIKGGNIDAIKRSWSHLSSLQQLCRGVVSANRETLWNDSTQMDIPVFVGREIQEYIFTKDRRERKLLNGSFTCKTFISI